METHHARILRGEDVILERVTVYLDVQDQPGRLKSWDGQIELPPGAHIELEGTYQLQLDDGRRGSFFITRMPLSADGAGSAEFQGSGPLE